MFVFRAVAHALLILELINGSVLWIEYSSRVCVGGYVVVGGCFGQVAGMIVG